VDEAQEEREREQAREEGGRGSVDDDDSTDEDGAPHGAGLKSTNRALPSSTKQGGVR